jgi:hypothetical protein
MLFMKGMVTTMMDTHCEWNFHEVEDQGDKGLGEVALDFVEVVEEWEVGVEGALHQDDLNTECWCQVN